jgi:hypothetical protein
MAAGLGFVFMGGIYVMNTPDLSHVVAGTAISTIAGAISAFIAKTFMDVHRLSLSQLNHYFQQPVLNSHVLTAQRLADRIDDKLSREKAYQDILGSVVGLITNQPDTPTEVNPRSSVQSTPRRKPKLNKAAGKDTAAQPE